MCVRVCAFVYVIVLDPVLFLIVLRILQIDSESVQAKEAEDDKGASV